MAFNLASIQKTRRLRAPKIVVGGPNKIGKTTFAAMAPAAVGILTEEGADAVDASAFPLCQTLAQVYEAIGELLDGAHEFQSVFLDSLDWLEPLVHAHVCAANKWENIEAPGYGKGYVAAAAEWRNVLAGFDALRNNRNMAVILIVHDKVKSFSSPIGDSYDTYTLKLDPRAAALVLEWADVCGFAGHRVLTRKEDVGFNKKEVKAVTTGERILHVVPNPAHFGGNRYGLQDMPLAWSAFAAEMARVQGGAA